MSGWQPRISAGTTAKWLGIVEAIESDVRSGRLRAGERLPPHRAIAAALGVDITTVTRALNEARRRALVEAQVGRGTFVSGNADAGPAAAEAGRPAPADLSMNMPPQPPDAALRQRITAGIAAVLAEPGGMSVLHYQESVGRRLDRAAGAARLARRLGPLPPERLVVAGGAQSALFALLNGVLPGTGGICAAAVTYPGLKAVAANGGFALHPLAIDAEGIIPEAFEACCREAAPRALYVVPCIDNPTTATLPEARRIAIAAIARRHDVAILEDDPYAALLPDPPPPIARLAPERTWHVATLSKCATPALRVAHVACPDEDSAARLAGVLRATNLMAPPLLAALASRWSADGTLDGIAAAIRVENMARQRLAAAALDGFTRAADPHGHHLWLSLPRPWRAADFAAHASRSGLAIVPGDAFATGPRTPEAARVSLGVAADLAALEDALARLAALLRSMPPEARMIV